MDGMSEGTAPLFSKILNIQCTLDPTQLLVFHLRMELQLICAVLLLDGHVKSRRLAIDGQRIYVFKVCLEVLLHVRVILVDHTTPQLQVEHPKVNGLLQHAAGPVLVPGEKGGAAESELESVHPGFIGR